MSGSPSLGPAESSRTAVVLAAVALLALGVGVGLAGTATAGDNVAFIDFEPTELDVEPGEEIEIDVVIESEGAHGDVGVREVDLRVDYPTEYLTVTAVEGNDWFHTVDDEGRSWSVEETAAIDDERGAVRLRQSISDRTGVVGEAPFATLTVEVAADAEPAIARMDAGGPSDDTDPHVTTNVEFTSDWPAPLSISPAELRIDGGEEVVEPAFDPEALADAGETETIEDDEAADDEEGTDGTDGPDGSDGTDDGEDAETTPDGEDDATDAAASDDDAPAPVGASVLGVLTALWLFRRR